MLVTWFEAMPFTIKFSGRIARIFKVTSGKREKPYINAINYGVCVCLCICVSGYMSEYVCVHAYSFSVRRQWKVDTKDCRPARVDESPNSRFKERLSQKQDDR